jgi:hypothetical protein
VHAQVLFGRLKLPARSQNVELAKVIRRADLVAQRYRLNKLFIASAKLICNT